MPDSPETTFLAQETNRVAADNSLALISLYEISKILSATLDLRRSLREVLNVLASYLQMRRGIVALTQKDGSLEIVAVTGMALSRVTEGPARFPLEIFQTEVIGTQMPLIVPSLAEDARFAGHAASADAVEEEVISLVGVPIKAGGKPLGTLSIERHREVGTRWMVEHDVRFLTMVANLMGQTVSLERSVAADRERLILEQARLHKALPRPEVPLTGPVLDSVIGRSQAMMRIFAQVHQVAPSRATVLLRGESGTGKELIAQAIHSLSPRADKPFIKVNCAALSESLLESELFGHEKGAFTGATSDRKGRFELASGGTLFLDEIGEISLPFQAKLLRVLQEGEFERVGGSRTLRTDVRLITATNKDLEDAVMAGDFRADLYYRINVVPLFLPALRDRKEDVPLLAQHFLDKFNRENARSLRFAEGALDRMCACSFPGNVRELENCVFRTAALAQQDVIQEIGLACFDNGCLSATLWSRRGSGRAVGGLAAAPVTEDSAPDPQSPPEAWAAIPPGPVTGEPPRAPQSAPGVPPIPPSAPAPHPPSPPFSHPAPHPAAASQAEPPPTGDEAMGADEDAEGDAAERLRLIQAMETAGWVQAKAARLLGLTPRQVGYALKKHNIPIKRL